MVVSWRLRTCVWERLTEILQTSKMCGTSTSRRKQGVSALHFARRRIVILLYTRMKSPTMLYGVVCRLNRTFRVTGQSDVPCERCPCWDTILTTTISQLSVYDLENGLGRYTYTDFARVVSKQKAHQTCRDIHKATSTSSCLRQSEEHLHPSILC